MSRRVLILISTLCLVFSIAGPAYASTLATSVLKPGEELQNGPEHAMGHAENPLKAAPEGIFLVRLDDAPLATYRGGFRDLAATSPAATGEVKFDASSLASHQYAGHLESVQATFIAHMEKSLGHTVDVKYTYKYGNNGMAVWLTPEEAIRVSVMSGVSFVQPDQERALHTDTGPGFIGAGELWGDPDCSAPGSCGEGLIVGVIDTGINPLNPSFADIGGDGYNHSNPLGAGNYVGVCDPANTNPPPDVQPYNAAFPCNDKLIGAWGYASVGALSPLDYDGHGSHTASTAAGNLVEATISGGARTPETIGISGVAPHAAIIAYGACCQTSALAAAIDQAIADGVDVINYSIGTDAASNPWTDFDTVGFLNAREAGVFVATSAGNEGPGAATVGSPADAPWLTSVGASTHSRTWTNEVGFTGGVQPLAAITGTAFTDGYGSAPIVYAGDFGDPLCQSPFAAATWTSGEIVICDRGTVARTAKSANVAVGGAGGMVLANDVANAGSLNVDAHPIPSSHISFADGVDLKAWVATGTGHMATIADGVYTRDPDLGDVIAAFSSRGANRAIDLVSPNVTAPGADIIAAHGQNGAVIWDFSSGTSMASPHVAGAAALIVGDHPTWTPAQVQSALMMTASTSILKEDGTTAADPFDVGSGRVDLVAATAAGLIMDETTTNYVNASPARGGDPRTLNVPSMADSMCIVSCGWTRIVEATSAGTWTATATSNSAGLALAVSPTTFTLAAGETQAIKVTANVGTPDPAWLFGEVTLAAGGAIPVSHMPLAAISAVSNLPSAVALSVPSTGNHVLADRQTVEAITDLQTTVAGLAKADLIEATLVQDPSNGDPFDDPTRVLTRIITVPAGASRLVAEVAASDSPDLDLFVGRDLNGDGIATGNELVCSSTSVTAFEYCSVLTPSAGNWWVLLQNWNGSTPMAADALTLATAVVAGDEANLTVSGPATVPAGNPFDLTLNWVLPDDGDGDRYYALFTIGASAAAPGDLGQVVVDLLIGVPEFQNGSALEADNVFSNRMTLSWPDAVGSIDVTGYDIHQDGIKVVTVASDVTEYTITGLGSATSYDFAVVAVGGDRRSPRLPGTFTTATDFTDDDTSVFEEDIEWLSGTGITRGCNPPANDQYCPDAEITRGQFAALMNRALNLPAATDDFFTDDNMTIFEDDIDRLAEAGISFGCDPPANNSFCPDNPITRGQMAAMFDRALVLPTTPTDYFTDDDGNIFEASINRLAAADITRGCNPPANGNYCPDDLLTRGQIAAFIRRALG